MLPIQERKALISAALRKEPLDRIIQNVRVLNVHTGTIQEGAIGILNGKIVTTQAQGADTRATFDGQGAYAIPGLLDTHVHLDSTLMVPEYLAELIVPHGTTTMLTDPMEMSNVAGIEGLKTLLMAADHIPYHILLEVSSRVPTAPGLETTGGVLGLEEVKELLQWPESISLGELDPSKILGLKDEYLAKVEAAHALGKIVNGHAAGLSGMELGAYACGGIADDHECVDYSDALARLSLGMSVLVREGSTERNLEPILSGALRSHIDLRHFMFCTDDKHPNDILREGHIDFMVNRAVEMGLPPLQAIQLAALNAAEHFHIEHQVGSLTPGRWADILLTPQLYPLNAEEVFVRGEHVASHGSLIAAPIAPHYPEAIRHTIHVTRGKQPADFILNASGETAQVWVIELYPDQIINRIGQATLQVGAHGVQADPDQDVLKLSVVERYGKNGNIGTTFVRGFGLKQGALASSVSHDHHNIVIAGTNDADMAACVRAIEEMQGGLALAAGGQVIAQMPLVVGGLMSEEPTVRVIAQLEQLTEAYHHLGGTLPAPFMTISFISLPTVPELGLTDQGLVKVREHRLISPFVEPVDS